MCTVDKLRLSVATGTDVLVTPAESPFGWEVADAVVQGRRLLGGP